MLLQYILILLLIYIHFDSINDNFINIVIYYIIIHKKMAIIQEQKYMQGKIERTRFFLTLEKKIVDQLALKKGDELFFNGELGGEIRFKLKRSE